MPEIISRKPVESHTSVCDHPVLDRIFKNRSLTTPDEIDYTLSNMCDYNQMADINKASVLLADAIESDKRIMCIGDYDADGATSTAIVIKALKMFGSTNARYIVPDRFKMGYGLTPKVADLAKTHHPDVIITVDNGIASYDGIEAIKQFPFDCKIIVTDHHLVPDRGIPKADAVVNPQRHDCQYGSKNIAGCGVAFLTMLATRDRLKERGYFNDERPEPKMAKLLDLVALGLMADVVPLDFNNRLLISNGLKIVNSSFCSPGIHALLEIGGRLKGGLIVGTDLSFCVAPRLNAAGRLESMDLGINTLLEDDPDKAREYAKRLDALNTERKEIEDTMKQHALYDLSDIDHKDNYTICVYNKDFHEGVQGIVASRIKDKFYRPVICFSKGEDGMIKGSGRSIPGFHLKHALDAINAKDGTGTLVPKYGGHAMAAGLSIAEENFELFCQELERVAREQLKPEQLVHRIETDGTLPINEMNVELASEIERLGPWGQLFPEPTFYNHFKIETSRVLQGKHLKMKLADDEKNTIEAIAFNCISDTEPVPSGTQKMVFKLGINRWKGEENLQLLVDFIDIKKELTLEKETDSKVETVEKESPKQDIDYSSLSI